MPYIAPIVAIIDRLGYLWCIACAKRLDKTGDDQYADNAAMDGETCDGCGKKVKETQCE